MNSGFLSGRQAWHFWDKERKKETEKERERKEERKGGREREREKEGKKEGKERKRKEREGKEKEKKLLQSLVNFFQLFSHSKSEGRTGILCKHRPLEQQD